MEDIISLLIFIGFVAFNFVLKGKDKQKGKIPSAEGSTPKKKSIFDYFNELSDSFQTDTTDNSLDDIVEKETVKPIVKPPVKQVEESIEKRTLKSNKISVSRKDLRKAVVMNEILDKPVSLR